MTHQHIYTCDDIKHLSEMICNISQQQHYDAIYKILARDKSMDYTTGPTAVLDLAAFSDTTLRRIYNYVKKIDKPIKTSVKEYKSPTQDYDEINRNRCYKLSNYEKNILKQCERKNMIKKNSASSCRTDVGKKISKSAHAFAHEN